MTGIVDGGQGLGEHDRRPKFSAAGTSGNRQAFQRRPIKRRANRLSRNLQCHYQEAAAWTDESLLEVEDSKSEGDL